MTDQSVDLAELKRLAEILANRPTEGQVTGGEQMRETIEAYVVFTKPQVILFILAQLTEAQREKRVLVGLLKLAYNYWGEDWSFEGSWGHDRERVRSYLREVGALES